MTVEHALQSFKERILTAHHLTTFLKKKPITVGLSSNGNNYYLEIKNDLVAWTTNEPEEVQLFIHGDEEALVRLVSGTHRLQRLCNRRDVSLKGSYSSILRAETIFYLNE